MNRRASRILTVCAGAWLLVIWGHSCLPAAQSGAESGALLVVVQDLLPWMTDHVLRKCAHFAEYAVLGALTAAALRTSAHFSWPRALLPGPFAALCDETIQLFVPGRSGRIADVWLDTAGYLTGALLTLLIFRLCRKRPEAGEKHLAVELKGAGPILAPAPFNLFQILILKQYRNNFGVIILFHQRFQSYQRRMQLHLPPHRTPCHFVFVRGIQF